MLVSLLKQRDHASSQGLLFESQDGSILRLGVVLCF
jgi:hypothetical protein